MTWAYYIPPFRFVFDNYLCAVPSRALRFFLFIHPYDKYINENNPYNYIIRIITGFLLCNYTGYSSLFIMCTRFTLYTIAGIITAYANGVRKLTP